MSGWQVAQLEQIDEIDDGRAPWRPIRHHFGITAFGVNAFTAKDAGGRLINEHDEADEHDRQEELYFVQCGHARFELDGEVVDAPTGTLLYVEPGVKRTAFAEEAGTTVLAVGGVSGKPYEVHGYELWAPAMPLYNEGRYAEAADIAREAVEAHPDFPAPLYNLACAESLAGRTDDAIAHLRLALERWPDFRELAKGDTDFDPIRDEPAFKQLVE